MTEKEKLLAFEKKLKQLKEEEQTVLRLLKDVRKQLKKYEVEELQTCSEAFLNKNGSDSDSEESIAGDKDLLLEVIDCAKIVNANSLDLEINKILGGENEGSEESEESD